MMLGSIKKVIEDAKSFMLALIIGFISGLLIIWLINQNIFGLSQITNTAYSNLLPIDLYIIVVVLITLVILFINKIAPILRSFFIGKDRYESICSSAKWVTVMIIFSFNPLNICVYGNITTSLAIIMFFIILAFIIICTINYVRLAYKKKSVNGNTTRLLPFIEDIPEHKDKNLLSASQLKCCEDLTIILKDGHPRSVSLTGTWGSGKTMVYNFASEEVKKECNNIVWLKFEPWRYTSEESLVRGFYGSIARAIAERSPNYHNLVKTMSHAVSQFIDKFGGNDLLRSFSNLALGGITTNYQPDDIIKKTLDIEKFRLIIVVDDIERNYSPKGIYKTLQLVHHAKLIHKDIQIVCIYEKEAILKAAPKHAPSASIFIEKFSEIDISVLPPDGTELQMQVDRYLDYYKDILNTSIFSLANSEGYNSHSSSYRSIIRIFNNIILQSRSNVDRIYKVDDYVCFNDRFAMANIELLYPIVYQDISKDRGRYTESHEIFAALRSNMDSGQTKLDYKQHFDELIIKSGLSREEGDRLMQDICDLFPHVAKNLDRPSSRAHISDNDLLESHEVAHFDILDAYFATTSKIDNYNQSEKLVNNTLQRIDASATLKDEELLMIFTDFLNGALEKDIESTSFFIMQQKIRKDNDDIEKYKIPLLRAWLRSVMQIQGSTDNENRRVLGRILTAANEIVYSASINDATKEFQLCHSLFSNITNYINDPRAGILMLLYIEPKRGNGYFKSYITSEINNKRGLFNRVLKKIENLIINNRINVFSEYDYGDWVFLSYQWAYSISPNGNKRNNDIFGHEQRYKRATKYLVALLEGNDSLAYKAISQIFNTNVTQSAFNDGNKKVDTNTFNPFDIKMIHKLTNKLKLSKLLDTAQIEQVKKIDKELSELQNRLNANS